MILKHKGDTEMEERILKHKKSGMPMLLLLLLLYLASIGLILLGAARAQIVPIVIGCVWGCIGWIPFLGLKVIKPQEALVLTLFGEYVGTLKTEGFYFVNPFCTAVNPAAATKLSQSGDVRSSVAKTASAANENAAVAVANKKVSLKIMTLNNNRQKINDCLGNPIEIGIAVMWRVVDTAKAVFQVDNYKEYLSLQCDSALRNIVRIYPYDVAPNVDTTGDGKPEIAAVMLQRQQASAIIDARKMIVDGAVGMVEMALEQLSRNQVVELDEERKAAMVSNLLVVLCGNHDAQPIVNSGSLY